MIYKIGWLLITATLGGCAVGPDYHPPLPGVPDSWQAEKEETVEWQSMSVQPIDQQVLKHWWKNFNDPRLDSLIDRALSGNFDLKIALSRIDQARAERSAIRAGLFPSVNAAANVQRSHNPFPGFAPDIKFNLFELGFDALWEIDLFGRLRRQLEAASADLDAVNIQYGQALVTLTADLARSYIEYRSFQNQLRITRANLAAQQTTQELTEKLFKAGVGTRYDAVRARAQTETTKAQIPDLEGSLVAALRQLERLTGQQPGTLTAILSGSNAMPMAPRHVILDSPAAAIRHRPDLRTAERRLAAATALQGAAIAELFPRLSLSAFLGLRNTELDALFKSAAFSYNTAAGLLQPLLNFGRIRAGIDLANARQQEAYLIFEKTILEALQEIETALTRYLKEEIRRQALARSVTDLREAVRLSQLRFQVGSVSFLDVLDAQRTLYSAEIDLARSEAKASTNLIAVYKALGGGADATVPPVETISERQ
ncbi:efflux transporter, outer membrane factor (OMF) lipoprotein, NodT family [Nitrosomonas eutropha]|uniref:efflux transporter outer membrane subunit n=1 Tax=Nitrosomonas TaxID=914 RepID=UPI0008954326|nr:MULTISPECIES: TolC family protein [Nitrosomonas]MXS80571.1 TolC family protein [Nitrosomonas sp. GH22]SDW79300.1 efflux transporter, outer membrane factor (OMF) lipoprotein, NodT family [Nitrosomonas eutropha]